ncbi:MAG: hypothetical protein KAU95_03410, partial [Candidatus Aenigmarchaeota archaeon]|nr:hypothetical protein [Candidatus Aenigmarchaeota archaeon]
EEEINLSAIYNSEKKDSYTVYSFGNTELKDVVFSISNISGEHNNISEDWLTFSPSDISSLGQGLQKTVNLSAKIPSTPGIYVGNIIADATGSSCDPSDECWDSLLLNITLYGRSAVNLTTKTGNYNRSVLDLTCRVYDYNVKNNLSNYPAEIYDNTTLLKSNLTGGNGVLTYSWDATNESVGTHKITCKISDNETLYYKVEINESERDITLLGSLNLNVNATPETIYWYDSHPVHKTNLTAKLIDEVGNCISNTIVHFYSNATEGDVFMEIGNCSTNSTGECFYEWNPSIKHPTIAKVHYNITQKDHYYIPQTEYLNITIEGGFTISIINPEEGNRLYLNETILLNATACAANGTIVEPDG